MKQSLFRKTSDSVILLTLVIVLILPRPVCAVRNIKVGDSLPTFFLPRADSISGIYSHEQLSGQPAIITFFRPNHEFSLEALRDLETITREVGEQRFKLIAVDSKLSTAHEIQASLSSEIKSFPLLLDPQRILYEKVGLIVCPTTLLFDSGGKLRFIVPGHSRKFQQVVRAHLDFLLGDIDEQKMKEQIDSKIRGIDPDLAAAWHMYKLGVRLQAEGKIDEAASVFEKTLVKHPSLAEAHCALGFLKFAKGDSKNAIGQFRAALANKPGFSKAQLGLAIVLARTGSEKQAEQILLSLTSHQSLAARARYELGRIYLNHGERDKALMFFKEALSVIFPEPWSSKVRSNPG